MTPPILTGITLLDRVSPIRPHGVQRDDAADVGMGIFFRAMILR